MAAKMLYYNFKDKISSMVRILRFYY